MNGQTAKATRREIRRAFGDEAINTIAAQDQAIRWLVNEVKTIRLELEMLKSTVPVE